MRPDECCPECDSVEVAFFESEGYWQCNRCHSVWAYPEDDPDNDEVSLDDEEWIARNYTPTSS